MSYREDSGCQTKKKACSRCGDICKVYYVTCKPRIEIPCPGPVGPIGPPGVTGPSGPSGSNGEIGATGIPGPTGNPGPAGPAGGPTGEMGSTGIAGVTGPTGYTGSTGQIGPSGDPGVTGEIGSTGPTGMLGPTGQIGPSGNPGVTGMMGEVGPTGMSGPTGQMGPSGETGGIGSTGPTGMQGLQGFTGSTGDRGPSGNSGPSGSTGPTGMPGPTGNPGPSGLDGGSLVWLLETTTTPATSSTQNIYRTGAVLISGSGSIVRSDSNLMVEADGSVALGNTGTISVSGRGLVAASINPTFTSDGSSLLSTENSRILNSSRASAILASATGEVSFGAGCVLIGTSGSSIGPDGITPSQLCVIEGSINSGITGSSEAAIISSSGCGIRSGNQSVILGSQNASINGNSNILLIGTNCIADTTKNIGLQIGGGSSTPINSADGIGITATITATGYPISTGTVYAAAYNQSNADYGEMFEWADGNIHSQDRRGYFVTFGDEIINGQADRIRVAVPTDRILGVVTETSGVIGNSQELAWAEAIAKDKFNQPIMVYDRMADIMAWSKEFDIPLEEIESVIASDPFHREKFLDPNRKRPMRLQTNPEYDSNQPYIPRSQRPEWTCVGLLGCVVVLEDVPGSCTPGRYVDCAPSGKACLGSWYRVLRRISNDTVMIFIR